MLFRDNLNLVVKYKLYNGHSLIATRLLDLNASYFGFILVGGAIPRVHVRKRSCYKPCQEKKRRNNLPF